MVDQIQKIVAELPDLDNVTDIWAVADGRLSEGDATFPADLGIALARAYGADAGRIWQYGSVFDHLLRLLATTPGPTNVVQALRLVSSAEVAHRKLDRYTASLLASSHPTENLTAAFTGHASEELRACLVHELALRGAAVTGVFEQLQARADAEGLIIWDVSVDSTVARAHQHAAGPAKGGSADRTTRRCLHRAG
ncbi:DUF6183 family protein [Streptomyces kronopolitis]|nr:DUF6183 family protein [Streptomyces kronopolitis]MCL6300744.1 DUF6183 family protein [Streptomyces kronopolitis]